MKFTDVLQSLLVLFAVAVGLALGQVAWLADRAGVLIIPFLMVMLVGVFLHVPLRALKSTLQNPRFTGLSLGINFLWTPLFGWLLGALFLRGQPDLWVGLIMLLVTPCTDWYLVFTQLARGDVRLATALLPWHLVLQLLLLPLYLLLFAGTLVPIALNVLAESVLLVLAVPLIAATLLRALARSAKGEAWLETVLLPKLAPVQLTALCLAITAMFASQGGALLAQPEAVLWLLPPLLIFFAVNLFLALNLGRFAGLGEGACTALCFATLSRNSPVSLAIAVTAFPERPLIALALVIGPLIELPVLTLVARALLEVRRSRKVAG